MKICSRCNEEKSNEEFYKHKRTKDGLASTCKECLNKRRKEIRRTKKFIQRDRYRQLCYRASHNIRGAGGKKFLTKAEWDIFCKKTDKELTQLIENWKESGFTRDLTPSIDRIDNNIGYEANNLQWLTLLENTIKFRDEKLGFSGNIVLFDGLKIQKVFRSQKQVAKYLSVDRKTINYALKHKTKIKGTEFRIEYMI